MPDTNDKYTGIILTTFTHEFHLSDDWKHLVLSEVKLKITTATPKRIFKDVYIHISCHNWYNCRRKRKQRKESMQLTREVRLRWRGVAVFSVNSTLLVMTLRFLNQTYLQSGYYFNSPNQNLTRLAFQLPIHLCNITLSL